MQWTEKQSEVINTRDKNILVSAAAGSGKTAVLTERIIQRILDTENPASIDRMLVVTFTKASAGEMRTRIHKELIKVSQLYPENEHIRKQLNYIQSAQISTIDSFCTSLLKDNFEALNIDPSFRIAMDEEIELIKKDVFEDILEVYFDRGSEDFLEFIELRCGKRYEDTLYRMINTIHRVSQSMPFPEKWLDSCLDEYDTSIDAEDKSWYKILDKQVREKISANIDILKVALNIASDEAGPVKYIELIATELDLLKTAEKNTDLIGLLGDLCKIPFSNLPRILKTDMCDETLKEKVTNIRNYVKNSIKEITTLFSFTSKEDINEEVCKNRGAIEVIINMTKDYEKKFSEYKRKHNLMDFNDLEHMALNILVKENHDGTIETTKLADEISKNYDEIMIDEYQDSNYIQEYILTAISGEKHGKNNLFMVGDVKQSIYRFRMAKPELFLNRYNEYLTDDSGTTKRINLDKNFRSREEVVNCVNLIFSQVMTDSLGGILYDCQHELKYGSDYDVINSPNSQNSELILVESTDNGRKLNIRDRERLEALAIAKRIKELMEEGFNVTCKDKTVKKINYGDIAILSREGKGFSDRLAQVLMDNDIPVFSEKSTGFYDTLEVVTILDFLRIIDNPHDDIPLAGVLKNIFHISPKEMALCRCASDENNNKRDFYDIITYFAYKEENEPVTEEIIKLKEKYRDFLNILQGFRKKVPYTSISDIIHEITEVTGFGYYLRTMESGNVRIANINLLMKKAEEYENTSYSGLFNFVRYMDNVKVYELERGEAQASGIEKNAVRIMTIHKSKGLEFPVVFLAGTAKSFNSKDSSGSIVISDKTGIGLDCYNKEKRMKKPSIVKNIICNIQEEEAVAEELRILYVAMTRAKEKLIIMGTEDINSQLKKTAEYAQYEKEKYNKEQIMWADSYLKLILMGLIRNKALYQCKELEIYDEIPKYPVFGQVYTKEGSITVKLENIQSITAERTINSINKDILIESLNMDNIYKYLQSNEKTEKDDDSSNPCRFFNMEYKYKDDTLINSKYSVSEIKKMNYENSIDEDDEKQVNLYEITHKKEKYIPQFIKKKEVLEGALRGTAYHRIFELIDYDMDIISVDMVKQQIEKLFEKGFIDRLMMESVDPEKIYNFLCSSVGNRMKKAWERKELYREQQYVMSVSADSIKPDYKGEETILVQGAVDAFFVEDGKVVIVDYKTDNVKDINQLATLYSTQLKYYGNAVKSITGLEIKECIIYSVKFNRELQIPY